MNRWGWKVWLMLAVMLLTAVFTLGIIKTSVLEALMVCVRSLVPSLFPFSVLSRVFCGVLAVDSKRKNRYLPCVIMGWVGGYPLGATLIRQASYESEDVTGLVCLSSCGSLGYIVGVVGASVCNNLEFGICLYLFQVVVSLVFYSKKTNAKDHIRQMQGSAATQMKFISNFVSAIRESALTMLYICAFTVVFSVISDVLAVLVPIPFAKALYRVVFEFSTGGIMAFETFPGAVGLFLLGFSVGFGGLSVHAQIFCFVEKCISSYRRVILLKLGVGVLCGAFSALYAYFRIYAFLLMIICLAIGWCVKNLVLMQRKSAKNCRRATFEVV
ncbi:MAG: hypothetical protein J6D21_04645 [Clostridia bacterium]|nr:hypothetical protein [Clostridia bacterium]